MSLMLLRKRDGGCVVTEERGPRALDTSVRLRDRNICVNWLQKTEHASLMTCCVSVSHVHVKLVSSS